MLRRLPVLDMVGREYGSADVSWTGIWLRYTKSPAATATGFAGPSSRARGHAGRRRGECPAIVETTPVLSRQFAFELHFNQMAMFVNTRLRRLSLESAAMSANTALREPEPVAAPPPEESGRSTTFTFEHKVFEVPGIYFALTSDRKPALHIEYGDLRAQIETRSLRRGFSIDPASADDSMLNVVERSLRFVREIRPNDSIPREVLDGTASWAADECHRIIAHDRMMLQLAAFSSGQRVHVKRDQISALAENPAIQAKAKAAIDEVAKKLGIEDQEKPTILDRIACFGRELAYIEAIRERLGGARSIERKVAKLLAIYKNDRFVGESLMRVSALINGPITAFDVKFTAIDNDIADIIGICKRYDDKVAALRRTRDDLFELYMMWEPILFGWENIAIEKCKPSEETVRVTFQFLARHYPQQTAWRRKAR